MEDSSQPLGKRRFAAHSSDEDEDSETSDDTWTPEEDDEEEDGEEDDAGEDQQDGVGVRTRSRGPAEAVVPEAVGAMDKLDDIVDNESDFSSSTEVWF